jgi:hypothetical protein
MYTSSFYLYKFWSCMYSSCFEVVFYQLKVILSKVLDYGMELYFFNIPQIIQYSKNIDISLTVICF